MKLVNLTPHAITLAKSDGEIISSIAPSGAVARVKMTPGAPETLDGIDVPVMGVPTFGEIVDLPAPEEGVLYIASFPVCAAAKRSDVIQPGTGPADDAIRENGRIVAVTRFVRHA